MNKKIFSVVCLIIFIIHILLNIFALNKYPLNLVTDLNNLWLEPSLQWSLLTVITSFVSLLLKTVYFKTWFNRFFIWYFPFAYLVTFTFPVYGGLMTTTRSDASVLLGGLMVLVTALWVGYGYLKTK